MITKFIGCFVFYSEATMCLLLIEENREELNYKFQ